MLVWSGSIADGCGVREVVTRRASRRWATGTGVLMVLAVALALLAGPARGRWLCWGLRLESDPVVRAQRVSAWVERIGEAGGLSPEPAVHEASVERALAVLMTSGSNVWPTVVDLAVSPPDRRHLVWLRWIRLETLRERVWQAENLDQRRRESALDVLYRLQPPGDLLVARLRPALGSPDADVRKSAIRCLACAGAPREVAGRELARILESPRSPDDQAAVWALGLLRDGATEAGPRLVALARREGLDYPGITAALGNVGDSAAPLVPDLERALDGAAERGTRLRLALALDRIAPDQKKGWRLLERAANEGLGVGAEATLRELVHLLNREGARESRYAALVQAALQATGRRWPTGCGPVLDVWQRLDPDSLRAWFDQALAEAVMTGPREVVEVAGEWVRRQPEAEPPRACLKGFLTAGDAEAPRAALHLAHAASLSTDEEHLLSQLARDPSTDGLVRDALVDLLERARMHSGR